MSAPETFQMAFDRAIRTSYRASELSRREAADALRSVGAEQRRHEERATVLARYAELQDTLAVSYAEAHWRAEGTAP